MYLMFYIASRTSSLFVNLEQSSTTNVQSFIIGQKQNSQPFNWEEDPTFLLIAEKRQELQWIYWVVLGVCII